MAIQEQFSNKGLKTTIQSNEGILMQEQGLEESKPSTPWKTFKSDEVDLSLWEMLGRKSSSPFQSWVMSIKEAENKMKEILWDEDKISTAMKRLIGIQGWIDPIEIVRNIVDISQNAVKENVKTGELMPDDKTRLSAAKTLLEFLDMMRNKNGQEVNVYLNDTTEYI